ncbi:MAG: AhpC/TSA family protein [Bacteroidales bacterium]|nr:AhpC/TSA family protein [Bacteroidales bacterium]
MKNLINLILIVGLLASCTNQSNENHNFTINGKINGDYSGLAFLFKRVSGEWIKLDSTVVKDGSFAFKGNINLPEVYYINLEGENQFASFFIEDSEISFEANLDDFRNPQIFGSASHAEYDAYKEKVNEFDSKLEEFWQKAKAASDAGDKETEKKLQDEFDKVEIQQNKFILNYAIANHGSVVSAYIILRNAYNFDETDLEPVVNNFDADISESVYVKSLAERIEILKRVAVGKAAIDFSMKDIEGNELTLSSLYGKYLLVDFWASWCGPCRRESPNVVSVYKNFKNRGFDILGVSFDKEKDKWIKAVQTDKLTWHHVGDLKGWGNAAGKLYGINSIPSNILLDPKGYIIAKNLQGEDLRTKLEAIFDE